MTFKTLGMCCAAALMVACGAPKPRPQPASGVAAPAPAGISTGAGAGPAAGPGAYHIDPAQSELRLLVYRAGALARLGHNHVIYNRAVTGWARYSGDPSTASFFLSAPVAAFVIDEADMRGAEGTDFSEVVSDDDKAGTRHNMLSPALLDGDRFPLITLTSTAVAHGASGLTATVSISVAGHQSSLMVPFTLNVSNGRLAAAGTLVLRQTALGLTPYSVMFGALQVQDEVTVKFKLMAAKS
jgi:hypothetical protein